MKDIINKIIEIDNKAKAVIEREIEKKNNIEDFIDSEFKNKKAELDLEYKKQIKIQQDKFNSMFEEKKNQIDDSVKQEILNIEKNYKQIENKMIEDILNSIKNMEE